MVEIFRGLMGRVGVAVAVLAYGGSLGAAQRVSYRAVPRESVEERLKQYVGTNQQREATLKKMFAEAGCDGQHLSEQPLKGSRLPNVVCVLPGSSEKTIIAGAHFDHVAEGDGVVDNWSGASLLPSLYEAVKFAPRKHTYIFIGFTDEERGEIGSRYDAHHMTKEQVAGTAAMVNMDTLGLGPTEVWAGHSDKQLMGLFAAVAKQLNVTVTGMNVDKVGSTDSEQFRERKIPSITIHSLTQETWDARILHTKKDQLSAMRLDEYYQTYRAIAAYVALLDERVEASEEKVR
jgi:Iap family predicted aminopeptidase